MRIRLALSVFLFTGFVCFHFLSFAQDIHFNLIKPPDDNPGATTFTMAQDAQGYLWLGTSNGLYKYDGYQYTAYHSESLSPNSPAAAKIDYLNFDKAGYLWMAPYNFGL